MKSYFLSKLSDINRKMAIHEGNAIQRLDSQAGMILLLPTKQVPNSHKKEFNKLRKLIADSIRTSHGLMPAGLTGIRNRTAAKYIDLLLEIEDVLRYSQGNN